MRKSIKEIREKNNELDKRLSKENAIIMTDIVCYLRVSNVYDIQVEEIRQDLLDMALRGQESHEPLFGMIGEDYKNFCDEIIRNAKPKSRKSKTLELLDILFHGVGILLLIELLISNHTYKSIGGFRSHSVLTTNFPISLGFFIEILVLVPAAYLIVHLIGKNAFRLTQSANNLKTRPKRQTWPKRMAFGALCSSGAMAFFLLTLELRKTVIFNVNLPAVIGCTILLFTTARLVRKAQERIF